MDSAFVCPVCSKPLASATAGRRHVAYCSRTQNKPRVRKRACQACNAAKVKCDFQTPCRRCREKKIGCSYDTRRATAPARQVGIEADKGVTEVSQPFPGEDLNQPGNTASNSPDSTSPHTLATSTPEVIHNSLSGVSHGPAGQFPSLLGDLPSITQQDDASHLTSSEALPSGQAFDFLDDDLFSFPLDASGFDFNTTINNGQGNSTVDNDLYGTMAPNTHMANTPTLLPTKPSIKMSRWIQMSANNPVRLQLEKNDLLLRLHRKPVVEMPLYQFSDCLSLLPSTNIDPIDRYSAQFIVQTLRAYPTMMLRRETFPPFVHALWYSGGSGGGNGGGSGSGSGSGNDNGNDIERQHLRPLPPPLAGGMAIAQLFDARTKETQPFLWHSIQSECRQARTEVYNLSMQDLLATIQIQIVYLIMRVVDGATKPAGLNYELLWTFKLVCIRFNEMEVALEDANSTQNLSWETWIELESKTRAKLVFFILSQVVSVHMGFSCEVMDHFKDVPLCAPKTMWDARTSGDWAAERAYLEAKSTAWGGTSQFRLATIGDLVQAQTARNSSDGHHQKAAQAARTLDLWNTYADGLGNLLAVATDMVARAERRSQVATV